MLTSLQALLRLASLKWLGVFVCALATLLATTSTASALEPAQTKTRVWGFDFAEHNSVGLFRAANSGKHQGNRLARAEEASGSLLAAKALPQIAKGANGQMLGQAVGHVKGLAGTAAQKADLFQQLGAQITKLSGGSWTAARGIGTEGSHVFLGGAGEALVINPAGQLFRGSLQTGGVSIAGPGKYALDFAKLTGL